MRYISAMVLGMVMYGVSAMPAAFAAEAPAKQPAAKPAPAAEASEADKAKKLDDLAIARGRAQQAIQKAYKALNQESSGWNAVSPEISECYTKAWNASGTALQKEQAKAAENQRAEYITSLNNKREAIQNLWGKQQGRLNQSLNNRYQDLWGKLGTLNAVYVNNMANVDASWTSIGLDPDVLASVYVAIEKECNALVERYEMLFDDYLQQLEDWKSLGKQVDNLIAENGGI